MTPIARTRAFTLFHLLASMNRWTKMAVIISADMVALPACLWLATLTGAEASALPQRDELLAYLLVAVVCVCTMGMFAQYRAVVRYIDGQTLCQAGMALGVAIAVVYLFSIRMPAFPIPRHAMAIFWLTAYAWVISSRLTAGVLLRQCISGRADKTPVAIYGAGTAGYKLAMALRLEGKHNLLAFFDDKRCLAGRYVAGVPVYHADDLLMVSRRLCIRMIVVATPSASADQRRLILARASQAGVPVRTLGSLVELAEEKRITARSIRGIKLDDLLGRDPVPPRQELISRCIAGCNVLVTGAGGSIGSELCRQIMAQRPKELHLLDHSEPALYAIHLELTSRFPGITVRPHLGSVCDTRLVERVVGGGHITTIYHAAAYKHVPLVEENIAEGVRNNIVGACTITEAAAKFRVRTCVLVSTDKAVRPTSVMGASKRVAELIFQAAAQRHGADTVFCMVRFGNVLGSSGSVVPLFQKQIESGGPITVTHPDVVRYFMSVPEAAQLVMQAGAMAVGGDVFVMDMGKEVRIADLARSMLSLCGLTEKTESRPDGDIEIRFVGLRPGEKLHEEPFAGNDAIPTRHPRIMTTTEYKVAPDELAQQIEYLLTACGSNDCSMLLYLLQKLVAGYHPAVEENVAAPVRIPVQHISGRTGRPSRRMLPLRGLIRHRA